jgi:hypothetical protein
MRIAGLGLALVASAQLTLLSSPALADGASASGSVSISGSASTSSDASASAAGSATTAPAAAPEDSSKSGKKRNGWILLGIGSAVTIGGLVVDIVGANSGHLAGEGGSGDNGQTDSTRPNLYFLGTTLMVAGIATAIYGGALVWSADHSTDTTNSPKPEDDAKSDSVITTVQAKLASAPAFTIPIVGATF